jgi:release factor glutamine methyltransferase
MSPSPAASGTVAEALASATDALVAAGVGEPRLDAELMLAEATGLSRTTLAARPETGVDPAAARRFGVMMRRRIAREPLAYVLGRRGFRRIELEVDSRVLVPRPESEILVELAPEIQPKTVLDMGTGSGAIALAIADEMEDVEVVATDVSGEALDVARANAERLGLADRVRFVHASLPEEGAAFDLLVGNLPYVTEGEITLVQPEVAKWEPRVAVVSGPFGIDAIQGLVDALVAGAVRADVVGLETGAGQGEMVADLMREAGYTRTEVRPDLAGLDRCVVARRDS